VKDQENAKTVAVAYLDSYTYHIIVMPTVMFIVYVTL
jgi:hypothetical protein